MNQPMPLKFKNYLHINALHMITFYYWEILICHFLIKIWRSCVTCLNWIISLKTQHVPKAQTPHVLIISILTKIKCFLIHLLSMQAFLTTIFWFVQCFARHFVKAMQNFYTTGLITAIIKNSSKKNLKLKILKQRLVRSSSFEELFDIFLANLNEYGPLKKKNKPI